MPDATALFVDTTAFGGAEPWISGNSRVEGPQMILKQRIILTGRPHHLPSPGASQAPRRNSHSKPDSEAAFGHGLYIYVCMCVRVMNVRKNVDIYVSAT